MKIELFQTFKINVLKKLNLRIFSFKNMIDWQSILIINNEFFLWYFYVQDQKKMVNVENQIFVFQDSSPVDLNSKTLRIIHFNDVYNIEGFDTEPFGGAARFKTAIDFFQNKKNLVLFSGDAFSPSTRNFQYLNQ